jgi:hypothetical protein
MVCESDILPILFQAPEGVLFDFTHGAQRAGIFTAFLRQRHGL